MFVVWGLKSQVSITGTTSTLHGPMGILSMSVSQQGQRNTKGELVFFGVFDLVTCLLSPAAHGSIPTRKFEIEEYFLIKLVDRPSTSLN